MANKTRKVEALSSTELQALVKKYVVTKSGSNKQVALRIWKLRQHVLSARDLKKIEDYLQLAPAKRYKGPRYTVKKDGSLQRARI